MSKSPLINGLKLRCPRCAQGKLLRGYISPRAACSACGEDFSPYKAEDGPAWLTILIVGHIVVPLMVSVVAAEILPLWAELTIAISAALALVALILPRAKGFFMAVLWMIAQKKA